MSQSAIHDRPGELLSELIRRRGRRRDQRPPGEVTLRIDGRLPPGVTAEEFLGEVRDVVGDIGGVEFAVDRYDADRPESTVDLGMFDLLADVLRERDPEAVPAPNLLTAATDARFFDELGIQTYGYTPLDLPEGFDFMSLAYVVDERVPVEAVEFGAGALSRVIERYGESA